MSVMDKAATEAQLECNKLPVPGNRILAGHIGNSMLEAVEHDTGEGGKQRLPTGAFSFNKTDDRLLKAVNKQLRSYLGTADHRACMSRFGLTHKEIDPALVVELLRAFKC
ncbi:hypothetical protein P3T23_007705 [Paraburkholderia sp. GAS448]|uniref:hypothetical protein n=1 Tax=Paraburkholderia sp. GAS448 TaxID=3035136 RepID=UPI003D263616